MDDLIAGRWWEPGKRRSARHGVLHLREDKAELRLTGVLSGENQPYCTYEALLGESASGDTITLLDVESDGVASSMRPTRTALSELLRPRVVLRGEIGRQVQLTWSEISVAFDHLDEWSLTANGTFGEISDHGQEDDGRHWVTYRFEFPGAVDAELDYGTVTLWCASGQGGDDGWSEFRVTREPRVQVRLSESKPLAEVEELILKPLRYFFSFAVDAPVGVRGLTLTTSGAPRRSPLRSQEVLFRRGDRPAGRTQGGPAYFEMLLPLSAIEGRFQSVLERWHALARRYEPIFDLLLAPIGPPNSAEAYFLQSVQAAELFHRRRWPEALAHDRTTHAARLDRLVSTQSVADAAWLRQTLQWSNEPTLQSRITDLVAESRLALRLSGDPEFPRRVARTRNYLIHRSAHMARYAAHGNDLWWMGLHLRALVRTVVLMELGFDHEVAWARLRDTLPVRQLLHHERAT